MEYKKPGSTDTPRATVLPRKVESRKRSNILFVKPEDLEDLQDFGDKNIDYNDDFHDDLISTSLPPPVVDSHSVNVPDSPPDVRKSTTGKKKRGRKRKRKLPKEHPCCDDSEDDMGLEAEIDDDEYIRRLEEAQEEEEELAASGYHHRNKKDRFDDDDEDDEDIYAYSPNQPDTTTNEYAFDRLEENSYASGNDDDGLSNSRDREVQLNAIDWEKALEEELAEVMDDSEKPELILPISSSDLRFPNEYLLGALGIYEVCRRYRRILRLSPFRLEDFLSAISIYENSNLLSEIHMCLLKVLVREDDANNTLLCHTDQKDCVNLSFFLMDHQTWPELLRYYLACTLPEHTVAIEFDASYPFVHLEKRLAVLQCLIDMFLTTSSLRGEIAKETLLRHEDFCRICHASGEVLCCDECSGVYHLQCLDPPLSEAPDMKWSCPVCLKEATVGVTDCVAEEERSGYLHQHDLLGKDRFGRKYWFIARRLIVESRELEPDAILRQDNMQLHSNQFVYYYSIWPKVEMLMQLLSTEWEADLLERLKSISTEMERQMELTVELTVNRWMLLKSTNESTLSLVVKEPILLLEYVETKFSSTSSSTKPLLTEEEKMSEVVRLYAEKYKENCWISTTGDLPGSLMDGSMLLTNDNHNQTNELNLLQKQICANINDLPRPMRPDSPTGVFEEKINNSSDYNFECLVRNRDGTRLRLKIPDSVLNALLSTGKQIYAISTETENNSIFTDEHFRLSDEGTWRKWSNLYTSYSMALSKQQHIEERDRRRLLQNKFSLPPPLSIPIELREQEHKPPTNDSSWTWISSGCFPAILQGNPKHILNSLRYTLSYIESQIPLALYCSSWSERRKSWHAQLLKASSPMQVGYLLATLEACIKPVCYHRAWYYSIGYLQLDRTLAGEREEQKRITALERKLKMGSELMDNSIIRTKNPRIIRHTVWKTRGEEYRRLGGDGWMWVSVTYGSKKQKFNSFSKQSEPFIWENNHHQQQDDDDEEENENEKINPLTKRPYRLRRLDVVLYPLREINVSNSLKNKTDYLYSDKLKRPSYSSSSPSFIDSLLSHREQMQHNLTENLVDGVETKLQELQELQQKLHIRRETICQLLESINQGILPTDEEMEKDALEILNINDDGGGGEDHEEVEEEGEDADNNGNNEENENNPLKSNGKSSTEHHNSPANPISSDCNDNSENIPIVSSNIVHHNNDDYHQHIHHDDDDLLPQMDGVNETNIKPRLPGLPFVQRPSSITNRPILGGVGGGGGNIGHPVLVKISSSSQNTGPIQQQQQQQQQQHMSSLHNNRQMPMSQQQQQQQQMARPGSNIKVVRILRPVGGPSSITVIPHGITPPNMPRTGGIRINRPMDSSMFSSPSVVGGGDSPMIQSVCSLGTMNNNNIRGRTFIQPAPTQMRLPSSQNAFRMQTINSTTSSIPRLNTNALFSRGVMASRRALPQQQIQRPYRLTNHTQNHDFSSSSPYLAIKSMQTPGFKPILRSTTPATTTTTTAIHSSARKTPLASRDGLVNTPSNALAQRAQQSLLRRQNLQAAERILKQRLTNVELKLQNLSKNIAKLEKIMLLSKKTTADSFRLEILKENGKTEEKKDKIAQLTGPSKKLNCPKPDKFCFINDKGELVYNLFKLSPENLRQCILRAGRIELLGWDIERKRSTQVIWPYPSARPGFCVTWRYRLAQGSDSMACIALHLRLFWHSLRWDDIKENIISSDGYCPLPSGGGLRAIDLLEERQGVEESSASRRRLIVDWKPKDKYGLIAEYLVQLQSQGGISITNTKVRSSYATLDGGEGEDDADSDPDFDPHVYNSRSRSSRRISNMGVMNMRRSAAVAARQSMSASAMGGISSQQWNVLQEEWMPEQDLQLWEIRSFVERRRAAENRMVALLTTTCVDDKTNMMIQTFAHNNVDQQQQQLNNFMKNSSDFDFPTYQTSQFKETNFTAGASAGHRTIYPSTPAIEASTTPSTTIKNQRHLIPSQFSSSQQTSSSANNKIGNNNNNSHHHTPSSTSATVSQSKMAFQKRQRLTLHLEKRAKQLEQAFFERKSLVQLKAMIEMNSQACAVLKELEDARELESKKLAEEAEVKKLKLKNAAEKRKRMKKNAYGEPLSPFDLTGGAAAVGGGGGGGGSGKKRKRSSSQSSENIVGDESDSGATDPCILDSQKGEAALGQGGHGGVAKYRKQHKMKIEKNEKGDFSLANVSITPKKRGRPPKIKTEDGKMETPTAGGASVAATGVVVKSPNEQHKQGRKKKKSEVYCVCKTPYDPLKAYIGCDKCDGWFHFECVGISGTDASHFTQWICPECENGSTKAESCKPVVVENNNSSSPVLLTKEEIKKEKQHKVKKEKHHQQDQHQQQKKEEKVDMVTTIKTNDEVNVTNTTKTTAAADESGSEVYCLCRTPYDDTKVYIACDGCDEWFHASCVGLKDKDAMEFCGSYMCPNCQKKSTTIPPSSELTLLSSNMNDILVSETRRRKLKKMLSQLTKQPSAKAYLGDRETKDPHTFAYVFSNLRHGSYSTLGEFIDDICRIFHYHKNSPKSSSSDLQSIETLEKTLSELIKNWIS